MASLSRNLVANFVGRSWGAILSLLLIPFYIKFMGVESYGLVGFYLTLTSVFGILDLGIGSTMNRELARRSVKDDLVGSQGDLVRTLEIIYWGIAIIVGFIVIIFAPFIANTWIKTQSLSSLTVLRTVQIMGLAIAFQFPMSLYQGGLMGLQKQVLVNILLIIQGTFRGGGAILVLYLISPTIQVFFAWQAISSVVGSLILLIALWRSLPKSKKRAHFRGDILKEIWKYAAVISVNALIGIFLTQVDKIILSRMLTLKMFSYYSIASTVASVVWIIINPFSSAIFPNLVQLHELELDQDLKLLFHKLSQTLSLILLPICAVLIIFSKQLLLLWLHDPVIVENCHLIVSCLVFGTMLNGIATVPNNSAIAFGWPKLIAYTNFIQSFAMIPIIIVLVIWFQGLGAAIAWIILNSVYIIFMIPIFFRKYLKEEKISWYVQDVFSPMLVSFCVCIISSFLLPNSFHSLNILIWLACTLIIMFITTGLILPQISGLVKKRIKAVIF